MTEHPVDVSHFDVLEVSWEIESEGIPDDEVTATVALIEEQQNRVHSNEIDHEYYFERGSVTNRTTEAVDIDDADSNWHIGISLGVGIGGQSETDPGVLRAFEVLLQ